MRVGFGFDARRPDPSEPLVLAGTEIEGEPGLSGARDVDPVIRALADALLGAAGLGDAVGADDPGPDVGAGGRSPGPLAGAVRQVEAENFQVVNADLTLVAPEPVISPHAGRVEETLAERLHVDPGRVSVGEGRRGAAAWIAAGEGLAAVAVVLLDRRDGPDPVAALRAGA